MTAISFGQVIPVTGPNIGFQGAVSRFGERVIAARPVLVAATLNLNFGDPAVLVPGSTGSSGLDNYDSVADFVAAAVANIGLLAQYFAGMAVREVKTAITYPVNQAPGVSQVGYYAPGQMAEVLERGSGTVLLSVGNPDSQAQLYTRVVLNGAITAGVIGDWETNPAASDLFSTTGTATAASTALTIASATNTQNNQLVFGPGIAPGTYVVSGGGTTSIVLSKATTAAIAAGTPVTFSNLVALPNVVARTGYVDANGMLEITIKIRNAA
jgi:hypothetical protein